MEERTILTSEQIEAALSRHRRSITLFKILTYGFGAGSILLFAADLIPVAAVCLVLTFVFGYQMGKHTEAQKKLLGESVVSGVLEQVFENVEYDPFRCIPSKLVEDAGMVFPFEYDSIQGSDHIKGVYKGLNVELSDIELYHVESIYNEERGDWEEKKEKCFQGQWLVCDFGKELSVHIHPLGICGGLPRYSVHLPRLKRHNDPECPVFCVGIPLCYSTVFEVLRSIQPSRIVFSGRKSERNAFP